MLLGAALSTIVGATIGTASLALGGIIEEAELAPTWRAWWPVISSATSSLLGSPHLGLLCRRKHAELPANRSRLEVVALLGTLIALCLAVFGHAGPIIYPGQQPYILFLPLIWASLRYGLRGATSFTLTSAAIAVWGTYSGRGPFIRGQPLDNLPFFHTFVVLESVAMLLLAAIVAEREQSRLELRKTSRCCAQWSKARPTPSR